jgi:hypothetical protein
VPILNWLDNVRIMVTAVLSGGRVSLSGDQSIRRDKGKKKGGRRAHHPPAGERASRELREVAGWNLESRLEEALKRGDAEGGAFWVGYAFPTRPGTVIENVEGVENPLLNHGREATPQASEGEGATAAERAALFLSFVPGGDGARVPSRVEISGLQARRAAEAAALFAEAHEPIYWLGDGEADESLSLISRLIASVPEGAQARAVAQLTDAVAFHEETAGGRVSQLLEGLAAGPSHTAARLRAVAWLGRTDTDSSFVLEVARDRSQPLDVRRQAVRALVRQGSRATAGASAVSLQQLYELAGSRELKAEIIMASPKRGSRQEVVQFLQEVERSEPDPALRERARWRLQSKKVLGVG